MCVIFFFRNLNQQKILEVKFIYIIYRGLIKWCLVFKSLIGDGIYYYIFIQNYFENYIIKNIIEFDKIQC